MAKGRIASIESMGLVDGPGIRTVVFFQGCALRCLFCHNPESWKMNGGKEISSDELIKKLIRFKPYFERSGGGVTFSGGEPLLQSEFLIEMLKKCKEAGIHTCIDTAGVGLGDYDEILSLTDLVLYDIKAVGKEEYRKMCSLDISETEKFQDALNRIRPETIIRQVVVPGINDTDEYMQSLLEYIQERLPFVKKVELLPYHKMGEHKYDSLGIESKLKDTLAMGKEKALFLNEKYFGQNIMKGTRENA